MEQTSLIKALKKTRHCVKHFVCIILFNTQNLYAVDTVCYPHFTEKMTNG